MTGTDFSDHVNFIKRKIVDILAKSQDVKLDLKEAIETKVGKIVSIITVDNKCYLNDWWVYQDSELYIRVRGIDIYIFTQKAIQ